ncbi:MAG: hypothetical protein K2Y56_08305 [Methylobacterium sp.]|uniref:hypothetical protein n=1 Tax=Methylobacterium sp. TaxID=409 RepID=UPI0025E894A1|nr:hypothetical protein [Methylobacterium sp.]MBX9931528.1 hypothetical protein [Methylobacterium sp.]
MQRQILICAMALGLAGPACADGPVTRIRGAITAIDGETLTIKGGASEPVTVRLGEGVKVASANKAEIADIKPDSYIGTAATPQADGSLRALEVAVFAPSMRGTGEGHYPWDLEPENTMTNGAVGTLTGTTSRTITVGYKGGEKTITVPEGAPIVALAPSDRSIVKTGARVVAVTRKDAGGNVVAERLIVGENGTVPPM